MQFIKLHIGDRRRTATTVYTYLYKRRTKGSIPLAGERFNRNESLFPVYKNGDTGRLFPDARRRSPVAFGLGHGVVLCEATFGSRPKRFVGDEPWRKTKIRERTDRHDRQKRPRRILSFYPTPPPPITEMCTEYKNIITCCVLSVPDRGSHNPPAG